MKDTIYRDDAIDVFNILADKMSPDGSKIMEQAVDIIKDLRSSKSELAVVTCAACKYMRTEFEDEFMFNSCSIHHDEDGYRKTIDDPNNSYCSWGDWK